MNEPAVRAEHRLRPEHGWVAAALPATARRLRVSDRSLAGMLAAAGADVCGRDPEVDIGPVETIAGDTPIASIGSRSRRRATKRLGLVRFNAHNRPPRPPQTPAAWSKRLYRK